MGENNSEIKKKLVVRTALKKIAFGVEILDKKKLLIWYCKEFMKTVTQSLLPSVKFIRVNSLIVFKANNYNR